MGTNKNHKNAIIIAFLLFGLLGFQACTLEEDINFDKLASDSHESQMDIPIANSNLTMWDILKDYDSTHLVEDEQTHFLTLIYDNITSTAGMEDYLTIPNQAYSQNEFFSLPYQIPIGDSVTIPTISQTIEFETQYDDQRYDSIVLKSGSIDLGIISNLNHNAQIEVTFPSIKRNNEALKHAINYSNTGSISNNIVDLSNTTMYFSHPTSTSNQIEAQFNITIYGDGNSNTNPYSFEIQEEFNDLKYRIFFGYMGMHSFGLTEDTIMVELFNHHIYGGLDFKFREPVLNLIINNSVGIPVLLNVNRFIAHTLNNDSIPIDIDTINVNSPGMDEIGNTKTTMRRYDEIDNAVNISPQHFIYKVSPTLNPLGLVQSNFVYDTSKISVNAQLELPLWGSSKQFVLQDTFDLEFESVDEIVWAEFKVVTDNGFPVDAKMQLFLVDSNYNIMDSILVADQQTVLSGLINTNGIVYQPTIKITRSKVYNTDSMKEVLKKTRYFFLRARMNTIYDQNQNQPDVKIYSYYRLHVKVGLEVDFKKEFSFN